MNLSPYETYKNSEINWLGDIPAHWKVRRIKDLCELQSGDTVTANEFTDEGYPVFGGNGFRGYFTKYNHNGEYILIGRQGALCGNINYAKGKFWASEHAVVVYKSRSINTVWFGEVLRVMNLNQYSLSAAQPGLSVDKIKKLELPVPPPGEQQQIARYLDEKTAAIDQKIALLEWKITAYQALRKTLINETVCRGLDKTVLLKNSGIEWIGMIPMHWEVKRLKDVVEINPGTSKVVSDLPDGKIEFLPMTNVDETTGKIRSYKFENYVEVKEGYTVFKNNDVLFAKITPCMENGNCVIVKDLKYNLAFGSTEFIVLRTGKNGLNTEFLHHFLRNSRFLKRAENFMIGAAGQKRISPQYLNAYPIALPPQSEQTAIADFLEKRTQQIDALISNVNTQIRTLHELRKTLINDVVTGKLKVTE